MSDPWKVTADLDSPAEKSDPWAVDSNLDITPEQSRQTFIQLHPQGPQEGQAALNAAEHLKNVVPPVITAQHPEIVSQQLYGQPMKATGLWERVKGSVESYFEHATASALGARQMSMALSTGKEDPELQKQIDEATSKADAKAHLKTVPQAILQIPLGLGYDLVTGASFVADNVAAALTLEPIRNMLGILPTHLQKMGQSSGEKFMGSFTGATYSGLRQEGIPPNIAAPFAIGGGLLMASLYGLKIDAIPGVGKALEQGGLDATAKAAVTGRMSRTAKTLLGSGGQQGIFGAITAGVNDTVYELAAITNNLVNEKKVPLLSIQKFGEDMGIAGLAGAAFGVVAGIPAAIAGIIPGGHLDTRIHEEAAKAEEAQKVAGGEPTEAPAPHPTEVATAEKMATATVGDIVEKPPEVPSTGKPSAPEEAVFGKEAWSKYKEEYESIRKATDAELFLSRNNSKEAAAKYQEVRDRHDRGNATNEELERASKEYKESTAPERERHVRVLDELDAREKANRKYIQSNRISEVPRMTEDEGSALDKATRSEEGTSSYIEKRPEIEKLNVQIEDLQARVAKGQEEFRTQLDAAKAEKIAAVKSLRAQMVQRTETNQMIRNIRDMDTSKIPEEFKAPLEALRDHFNTTRPTASTMERLQNIRQAIEDGTAPTVFAANDLARLNELSKYPLRDLPAADLKTVHDAIMAYYTAGRDSRIIHDRDLAMQSEEAVKQAIVEVGGPKITKDLERFQAAHPQLSPEEAKAQFSQLTKGGAVEDVGRFVKNLARWYKASNMGYESMLSYLGGGEDSLLYRVGSKMVDAGDDVYNTKKYEYSDPIFKWLEEKKLNMAEFLNERRKINVDGFSGEMERGHIIAMAGLKSTESGWDSLKNGFALQGDREHGKIYHLSEKALNEILSTMDETDRGFLQQVSDLGKRTGVDMGATFRKMYGYDLKLLDPYYPIYRVMSELGLPFEEEIIRQRDQSSFTHAGVDRSHTIERVGSTKPVWLRNAGNDLMDVIDSSAMFVGLGDPVRNASRLLFNSDFAKAVKAKYGDEFYKQLTDGLKAVAGTKKTLNAIERFTLNIRNRGIGAVLGFNISTSAINRILVERSLAGYVPAGDWTKGQAYVALHPKSTHEYLMDKSTLYRQIWEGGSMQEIREVLASKGSTKGLGKVFKKAQEASMMPIKLGFAGATKGEMWSAITQARRELKEWAPSLDLQRAADLSDRDGPNLTEQQKDDAAIKYAEYIVKRTHANPREMYAANIKRQGVMGMLAGTLMSEKNALLQLGIRRALDIKTPGGGKRFAKYLLVGVLGEALTITAVRQGIKEIGVLTQEAVTGKKEKKKKGGILEEAITELAGNTVGLGFGISTAVYPVERAITSQGMPVATNTSLIGQFEADMVKMIQDVKRGVTGKTQKARDKGWGDAFESFMSFAVPLVTRVPYKHGIGDVVGAVRNMEGGQKQETPTP
jgi:hypothetical protein